MTLKYDVFISYKRSESGDFAAKLEQELEKYTPPGGLNLQVRPLNVFRDKEDLTGNEYYQSIEKTLSESAKLVVICTPLARSSHFVNDEIRRFAAIRGPSNIIPVLVLGLPNNEAVKENEKAFPEALFELGPMPLAIDYRSFNLKKDRFARGEFFSNWYTLLANVFDVDRSTIEQRDRKRQARKRKILAAIAIIVVLLLSAALVVALIARKQAIDARQLAENRLYVANLNLARKAVDDSNMPLAYDLLNVFLPNRHSEPTETSKDVRSFYWYHLWRSVHQESATLGHSAPVSGVAVAPNGHLIATSSLDQTTILWDAERQTELGRFPATTVVFSPDSSLLVGGLKNGEVVVWNALSGKETLRRKVAQSGITSIALSPDAHILAVGDASGIVRVWDFGTMRSLYSYPHYERRPVVDVTFCPTAPLLASAGGDGAISLWDLEAREKRSSVDAPTGIVTSIAFSSNGRWFAGAGYGSWIRVWDTSTQVEVASFTHSGDVTSVAFSPDDRTLASGSSDDTIKLWNMDTKSRSPTAALKGHARGISALAFFEDGRRMLSGSTDRTVRLWNLPPFPNSRVLSGHTDSVRGISFAPDSNTLASSSAEVRLWKLDSPAEPVSVDDHEGFITAAAFSPNGDYLATAGQDKRIILRRARTLQILAEWSPHKDVVTVLAFSPDGQTLASGSADRTIGLSRIDTGGSQYTLLEGHSGSVSSLAFSPDGKTIVSGARDGNVYCWNPADRMRIRSVPIVSDDSIISARYTTDSDADEGQPNGPVIAFCPGGQKLAIGLYDSTIRIWDLKAGRELQKLKGHLGPVTSVAFTPDGMTLASTSFDGTVRLWSLAVGQELVALQCAPEHSMSAVFSPNGRALAASCGITVRLWLAATPADIATQRDP